MKEFKPSADFVSRIMAEVRAYEARRAPVFSRAQPFLSAVSVRYALSAAGGLLGIINLARLYLALFSPAVCR